MNKKTRTLLLGLLGFFMVFVFLSAMGAFDSRPYLEVPHGSHSHYLPKNYKDCNPPLAVGNGTQTRPGDGETVNCQGQIVPVPVSE